MSLNEMPLKNFIQLNFWIFSLEFNMSETVIEILHLNELCIDQ